MFLTAPEKLTVLNVDGTTFQGNADFASLSANSADVFGSHFSISGAAGSNADIIPAPDLSSFQVRELNIRNTGAVNGRIRVRKADDAPNYFEISPEFTLSAGDVLRYSLQGGWQHYSSTGKLKNGSEPAPKGTGYTKSFLKVGTAKEAAGVMYSYSKDSGFPGAWSPGTPGLAGRTTDGLSVADAGCISFNDPTGGAKVYLMSAFVSCNQSEAIFIDDILWVNSGISPTTLTAQTINSVELPPRDNNNLTNGEGVFAAILVTTATTNAAAIANTTMSYTNSDGVAGRTATITTFPATAAVGSFIQFQLQGGDKGIRSIQSITLGTSYGTGAVISLVLFDQITSCAVVTTRTGDLAVLPSNGMEMSNRACLLIRSFGVGTTAGTVQGNLVFEER